MAVARQGQHRSLVSTSVTLSTTTNAPSRRFAHRWSSATQANAGPERCGVAIPGMRARPRPIVWKGGGAPRPRAMPAIRARATAPSAQVVESLATALRLSDTERELLYHLAGHTAPVLDIVPSRLTPSVQRLLDRLANTPVVVYDATWTLVLANAAFDAFMGETSTQRDVERNAIWHNLAGPGTRTVHTPQQRADHEARLVADLRLTAARYPPIAPSNDFISQLADTSPRFAELWNAGAAVSQHRAHRRSPRPHR